jgi:hypothetical protein
MYIIIARRVFLPTLRGIDGHSMHPEGLNQLTLINGVLVAVTARLACGS